jgi:tRNA-specific 2-thiouridylase
MSSPSILVAMSGGVDSSVAAALLADQGWDVVGVTMKLWGGESDTGCCSVSDVDDARRVAQQLGIDHHVFSFGDDFATHVVEPYVAAHAAGRTPNPCIECNRHLKFDRLLGRAALLGIDAVATGHHARVVAGAGPGEPWRLARGADRAKDQSYVVHMLDQASLGRVRFPVGHTTKDAVRAMAASLGLRTATKPDSQDVCFITSSAGRKGFLERRLELRPAVVVDTAGREVGRVEGVELVTIGQRRGVTGGGTAERTYVVDVDVPNAVVTVGPLAELLVPAVALASLTWVDEPIPATGPQDVLVQVSAHGQARPAIVDASGVVRWAEPQRRVAPGQAVVLYDPTDTYVLGGGVAGAGPGTG